MPVAVNVCEYAVLTTPFGSGELVVIASGSKIVIESACVFTWFAGPVPESVACAVKLKVPEVVGVPAIVPLGLNVSPGGNVPAATDQVTGVCPPKDDGDMPLG